MLLTPSENDDDPGDRGGWLRLAGEGRMVGRERAGRDGEEGKGGWGREGLGLCCVRL